MSRRPISVKVTKVLVYRSRGMVIVHYKDNQGRTYKERYKL